MDFGGGELVPIGGGDKIPLRQAKLTFGRSDSCDICLRASNVSSRHGELIFEEGVWYIRDRDSTNGVRVNGIRIPPGVKKLVKPGDKVSIGQRQFTLEYEGPEVLPASEFQDLDPSKIFTESLLERAGLSRKHFEPEPHHPPAAGVGDKTPSPPEPAEKAASSPDSPAPGSEESSASPTAPPEPTVPGDGGEAAAKNSGT